MRVGFGLQLDRLRAIDATIPMTGLTAARNTEEARIGSHAGISVGFPSGVTAWSSQTWGVGISGDTTYGTGASPTDFTASNGARLLWRGIGDDGKTYHASAPIRYAPATLGTALIPVERVLGDDAAIATASAFVAGDNTLTYSLVSAPAGMTINASTGAIDASAVAIGLDQAVIIGATDTYGWTITADLQVNIVAVEITLTTEPTIAGVAPIAAGETVSDVLARASEGVAASNDGTAVTITARVFVNAVEAAGSLALVSGDLVQITYEYTATNADLVRVEFDGIVVAGTAITVTSEPTIAGVGLILGGETSAPVIARMTNTGGALTSGAGSVTTTIETLVGGSPVTGSTPFTVGQSVVIRVTFSATGAANVVRTLEAIPVFEFQLNVLSDQTMQINNAAGTVSVTVSAPSIYAGVHIFSVEDLATGPVNLVPAVIETDGSPAIGEALTIVPGLWVYNPDLGIPTGASYQWTRGGANIGGATASSYTLVLADDNSNIAVRETLSNTGGSRSVASLPVAVGTPVSAEITNISGQPGTLRIEHTGTLTITPKVGALELGVA